MKKDFALKVRNSFNEAWDEFGDDTSTEFLIGITADRMGIAYGDVVHALSITQRAKGQAA